MLKEERYDKILEMLEEENYISTQKLGEALYVSLPTIRRDLAQLQMRKQIIRSHGGAKKIQSEHTVTPLDFRKTLNSTEKIKLCRMAATLVKDNDVVFADASSTLLQIADFLEEKKNITVITNGIPLSAALVSKGIKTYCTGGEIFENSLANFGGFAEEFIKNFNIDISFFSCHGVSKSGMLTDPSLPETQIRKTAIAQSAKSVFLCDESKLNLCAPFNLVHIGSLDFVVTNSQKLCETYDTGDKCRVLVV